MKIRIFALALLGGILVSCGNAKEKKMGDIHVMQVHMDSILKASPVLKPEEQNQAQQLVQSYLDFATQWPDDSLAPRYMLQAAVLLQMIPDYMGEINVLQKLASAYPQTDYAPQALSLAAKVSEEEMNDANKARKFYAEIKDKYPNSDYAVNIDLQIEFAGDPEGLLDAIRARHAAADSTQTDTLTVTK